MNKRVVYLNNLIKKGNYIDWSSNEGKEVEFIYNDIKGKILINKYIKESRMLEIEYKDNPIFKISTNGLKNCKLGKLLGEVSGEFKYEIGYINGDIQVTDRYKKIKNRKNRKPENEKRYKYKCSKCSFNDGDISESNLKRGVGCSCCSGQTVVPEINSIWAKARWMCDEFGLDKNFALTHTCATKEKGVFKCKHCGKEKIISISNVYYRHTIGCTCGDGFSYPEKFMMSVLNQLDIKYITQLSKSNFLWCDKYKYDFYFEYNNKTYIIETHGIQHYEDQWTDCKSVKENDNIKFKIAREYIDEYIVIDCRYSEKEYIKGSILNSKLNEVFNLNDINWSKCEEYALKNIVKEVANRWNNKKEDEVCLDIANEYGLSRSVINKYLHIATKLKWCNYNGKMEMAKNCRKIAGVNNKQVEVFENGVSKGTFKSASELERCSRDIFGDVLYTGGISLACRGKRKQYKGYMIKYIEDDISCYY